MEREPGQNPQEEFDDSPYADTNRQRAAYQENLKRQRSNLQKEDASVSPVENKILEGSGRFGKPTGLSKSEVTETKAIAKSATEAFRKKQQFDRFYRSMSYDEKTAFMRKDKAEKDRIFEDWRRDKQ